jgi:membrane-associated phospholipid phosphatase
VDALPIALVVAIAVVSLIWNLHAGLTWTPAVPLPTVLVAAAVFVSIAVIFSTVFSNRPIVELATYYGLWAIFPLFCVRLNYLSATFGFPLQDELFARADAALGFDWRTWSSIAWSHPVFINVLEVAYESNIYQPFILVLAFALWGPRGRNREFLIATALAALVTVVIAAALPAFGPNRLFGIASGWSSILEALRSGSHQPLHYVGIVTFPSFHASMALILTTSVRSNRYALAAASIVNGLMLIATVPIGYHYLVDIIAGCAIGFCSVYIAKRSGEAAGRRQLQSRAGDGWRGSQTQDMPAV